MECMWAILAPVLVSEYASACVIQFRKVHNALESTFIIQTHSLDNDPAQWMANKDDRFLGHSFELVDYQWSSCVNACLESEAWFWFRWQHCLEERNRLIPFCQRAIVQQAFEHAVIFDQKTCFPLWATLHSRYNPMWGYERWKDISARGSCHSASRLLLCQMSKSWKRRHSSHGQPQCCRV